MHVCRFEEASNTAGHLTGLPPCDNVKAPPIFAQPDLFFYSAMVIEALAAVGLAGNIVQFIDFAYNLLNATTAVHHSCAGASPRARDIESITKELQEWCAKIASRRNSQGQLLPSHDNKSLVTLVAGCEDAAIELISALQDLKAKKVSSRWSCFRAALAATWKAGQINDMEKKLEIYRQQIIMELSFMQRYHA